MHRYLINAVESEPHLYSTEVTGAFAEPWIWSDPKIANGDRKFYVFLFSFSGNASATSKRHNGNLHGGNSMIVRLLEYIVGRQNGTFDKPIHPLSFRKSYNQKPNQISTLQHIRMTSPTIILILMKVPMVLKSMETRRCTTALWHHTSKELNRLSDKGILHIQH